MVAKSIVFVVYILAPIPVPFYMVEMTISAKGPTNGKPDEA